MEESNPVQTAGIREFLAETMAEEFDRDSFHKVAAVVSSSEKSVSEMTALLADWEGFTKSLGVKASTAGVLHGFCTLSFGNVEAAEEALKSQKRTDWGAYWLAKAHLAANHPQNALTAAEEGHEKFKDMLPLSYVLAEVYVLLGKTDEAEALLKSLKKSDGASAEYAYHQGLYLERTGDYPAALQSYRRAIELDSQYPEAYFRLGYLLDLHGSEADEANDDAVSAYEACVKLVPIHTNAVMNLGVLYEDRERYHDAIKCYETVLRCFPNHERARLYFEDVSASTRMFYDKEMEKKADRQSQVLKIPVSDFELSVRSRNCLQKMNIQTLGDLIMKTEQELLSYKNFGETSLAEIKEMLSQKGLRLGQGVDSKAGEVQPGRNPLEATASPETLDKSIDELDLSVRSRRCMERLDVRSLRDLINKTEVELMSAKNFGMTSLNEIKRKLAELGLSLRS